MESRYRTADAQRFVEKYGAKHGEDLALRVYTSQLLGAEPELVLHGGGNTSVKSRVTELLGDTTEVLFVKGSGWDLATIEPRGFPACRLAHLRRMCEMPSLTDEQMVSELRGHMVDPSSPTPSVEALLHAHLPAKFVDHTHADAVLALVDQVDSEKRIREALGERVLFVPYVMPGFDLARAVAALWRKLGPGPEPTAMVLDKHGIFTWGKTALESYERMIACVTRAERHLMDTRARSSRRTISGASPEVCAKVAPVVRGALARASGKRWIASMRTGPDLLAFVDRDDLEEVAARGCITPDHVIRTRPWPMIVRDADPARPGALKKAVDDALAAYATRYRAYFKTSSAARGVTRVELDPWPRVVLLPGLGALAFGKTRRDAEVAADVYEHTASVIDAASAIGDYTPVDQLDLFDVEYWSLEQAKLAKGADERPLDGRIALVTGAAHGIGLATARAMLAAGAHVVLADRDGDELAAKAAELTRSHPARVSHVRCDVTREADVRQAVGAACGDFGGLDIVVSNAGTASAGALHEEKGDRALRASLDVNLLGHQTVARVASEVMIAQSSGGALLFNASKSAFNQGPEFGPYAVPKAALIALMRQYAVDLGPLGIRSNAVNADRIRTALFGGGMAEGRAAARGITVEEYFRQNLLHRETTATDVAAAFVYLAGAEATTGCVITVDGGNSAAFPR